MSETEGKFSVELFKEGGEGAGQEEIIDRHDNLTVARARSIGAVFNNIRAGWSCCATELAFWRGAIDRRRCPDAIGADLFVAGLWRCGTLL